MYTHAKTHKFYMLNIHGLSYANYTSIKLFNKNPLKTDVGMGSIIWGAFSDVYLTDFFLQNWRWDYLLKMQRKGRGNSEVWSELRRFKTAGDLTDQTNREILADLWNPNYSNKLSSNYEKNILRYKYE